MTGAAATLASAAFADDTLDQVEAVIAKGGGEPTDEDFWFQIRSSFTLDPNFVNFNNGGCSPSPRIVAESVKRQMDYGNQAPSYYMWQHLDPEKETVRKRLAKFFKVGTEEIAITRNASESLETCLFGLDLKAGDEVVASRLDYPRMLTTLQTRERREGIKLTLVESPTPSGPKEDLRKALLQGYRRAISDKTKAILVSHVSFMNGQIFPIQEVCALGKAHGIPVVVDGAHAFAQFMFDHDDFPDCEMYGASLHKWLMAPMGTGLLYVKQSRIPSVWPLMAAAKTQDADIRKYEEIGTHQAAIVNGIGEALTFAEMLGTKRKEARLRHLRSIWTEPFIDHPRAKFFTSLDKHNSCGLTTIGFHGIKTADLQSWLMAKKGIYCISIVNDFIDGLRITPNVYSLASEAEQLRDALLEAVTKGI